MPISSDIVRYFASLSNHINDRRSVLINHTPAQGANVPAPENFQIDLDFKANSLKALDKTMLPSHALFMHMEKLEQAIYGWRYKTAIDEEDEREAVAALKVEITEALKWFKHHFVGQLYAEVDTHHIQMSQQDEPSIPEVKAEVAGDNPVTQQAQNSSNSWLSNSYVMTWLSSKAESYSNMYRYILDPMSYVDEYAGPPVPPLYMGPKERTDNLRKLIGALDSWFDGLGHLAGKDFDLSDDLKSLDDATLHVQRINAAKEHIVHARQSKWVVDDALVAFEQLQTLLARADRQKGAEIPLDELTTYLALYKRIQPFITGIFRPEEVIDETEETNDTTGIYEWGFKGWQAIYQNGLQPTVTSLSNLVWGKSVQDKALTDKIPENLDNDICALLQGKDASDAVITPSNELANQWCLGLGPLSFFKQVEGQENPLKTLMLAEQARLASLTGHNRQNIFDNKNMAVLADIFERIAQRTPSDSFSAGQITDNDFKFKDLIKDMVPSELTEVTDASNAIQNIERTRYDMMVLSQIVNLLKELISDNRRWSRTQLVRRDGNIIEKMKCYVALLRVYFAQGDVLQIEEDLTLANIINQLQNFLDDKEPEAALMTEHYIEQLEKVSDFLHGRRNEEDATADVIGRFEALDALSLEANQALNLLYHGTLATDGLKLGQRSYSFQAIDANQAFINNNHTIKAEIDATLEALSGELSMTIKAETKDQLHKEVGKLLSTLLAGNVASKDVFKVAYILFEKLNCLSEQLLSLSNEPQKATFYQETIDALKKELSDISGVLTEIATLQPTTIILVRQLQHYCYVLKGALPDNFSKDVAKQEEIETVSEEHQSIFGELPIHWQQALMKFEYQPPQETKLVTLLDDFQEEMRQVRQLQIWEPGVTEAELIQYWYDDIVQLKDIDLKKEAVPMNSFHKILREAKLEGYGRLLINEVSNAKGKQQICLSDLSEDSTDILKQFHKTYNDQTFKTFWQSTVPSVFEALATFEIDNYLSAGSTTEKLFECIEQLQSDIAASRCCSGISKEAQYQLFHDTHFSIKAKEKADKIAEPREQQKQQAEKAHQELSEFLEAIKQLKSFPVIAPPSMGRHVTEFVAPLPSGVSPTEYLNVQRKVQTLFNQVQPALFAINKAIKPSLLSDLSGLREMAPSLITVTKTAMNKAQAIIDVQQDRLSLACRASMYYGEKNTQYLAEQASSEGQVNQRKLKKALLEMMATRMISDSYTAFFNEEQDSVHFGGPNIRGGDCIGRNEPLFYHQASSDEMKSTHDNYDGKQQFVNAVNAEMEKVKLAEINQTDLLNLPVDEAKKTLGDVLGRKFRECKKDSFYFKQLHTIKVKIEEFKKYLKSPQFFTENEASIKAKFDYLRNIEKHLNTPCTGGEDDITAGSIQDIKQRFENIRAMLVPNWADGLTLEECQTLNNDQHQLRKDRRPNFFVFSETLAFFGYWFVYGFRALKGIFGSSNDTTPKERLTTQLFETVLETPKDDAPSLVGLELAESELDSHERMRRLGMTQNVATADELAEEVNQAAEVQNREQGAGILRFITDPLYRLTNWSLIKPPEESQHDNQQVEEEQQQQSQVAP